MNLYGSTRNYTFLEEHSHLNEGLGEGVSFRGRLLIALRTDILDPENAGPSSVEVEPCQPVAEVSYSLIHYLIIILLYHYFI